jgi:hypothetical protein
MSRTSTLPTALVVVGIALLVAPALVPIPPVLMHDTGMRTLDNESQLRAEGFRIIAYENMSDRGQQLYVESLEADGVYSVPLGQGAPEFGYPTAGELGQVEDYQERRRLEMVVIERPEDDSHLPPADEPAEDARYVKERYEHEYPNRTPPTEEEIQEQIARYDMMTTRTDNPPPGDPASLARLAAAALGVVSLGTGGYLRSKPR